MTGRAQMWDGAEWISMTGGVEDTGGGGDPDDTYLRLDAANNPASPNNFLRKLDGDILYLAIGANAVSASKWQTARTITAAGDVSGSVSIDGSANKTFTMTVANDSHSHSNYSSTGHTHTYLPLTGGTLTGLLVLNNSGEITGNHPSGGGVAQLRNIIRSTSEPVDNVDGRHSDIFVQYT